MEDELGEVRGGGGDLGPRWGGGLQGLGGAGREFGGAADFVGCWVVRVGGGELAEGELSCFGECGGGDELLQLGEGYSQGGDLGVRQLEDVSGLTREKLC